LGFKVKGCFNTEGAEFTENTEKKRKRAKRRGDPISVKVARREEGAARK
jgi:hypothetical protein